MLFGFNFRLFQEDDRDPAEINPHQLKSFQDQLREVSRFQLKIILNKKRMEGFGGFFIQKNDLKNKFFCLPFLTFNSRKI